MPQESEGFVPRCESCGYNLTGLTEQRCPECGRAFDLEAMRDRAKRGTPSSSRLFSELFLLPVLFSLPMFCCGSIVVLETTPGIFPLVAGVFVVLLVYNGDRVRDKVSHCTDHDRNRFPVFIARRNILALMLLQLVPLFVFWAGVIWAFSKMPPLLWP